MNVTTAPADGLRPSTESDSPAGEQPGDSTRRAESPDSQDPDNPPEPPEPPEPSEPSEPSEPAEVVEPVDVPEPPAADHRPSTGPQADPARTTPFGEPLIEVNDDRAAGRAVSTEWIERHLRDAVAHVDRPVARISVRLLDDSAMAELHERIDGARETTDVLTFDSSSPGAPLETDIALSVDVAEREAGRRGHDVERELLLYALHGVLHCTGHDDHDEQAWKAMHETEDHILETIGIGATFRSVPEDLREIDTR